jgi:hypothetical protein
MRYARVIQNGRKDTLFQRRQVISTIGLDKVSAYTGAMNHGVCG